MTFTQQFLDEAGQILKKIDTQAVDRLVALLATTRAAGGRLFILGVGGSAGNASHAVNDFRKIVGIEAYAPTDFPPPRPGTASFDRGRVKTERLARPVRLALVPKS